MPTKRKAAPTKRQNKKRKTDSSDSESDYAPKSNTKTKKASNKTSTEGGDGIVLFNNVLVEYRKIEVVDDQIRLTCVEPGFFNAHEKSYRFIRFSPTNMKVLHVQSSTTKSFVAFKTENLVPELGEVYNPADAESHSQGYVVIIPTKKSVKSFTALVKSHLDSVFENDDSNVPKHVLDLVTSLPKQRLDPVTGRHDFKTYGTTAPYATTQPKQSVTKKPTSNGIARSRPTQPREDLNSSTISTMSATDDWLMGIEPDSSNKTLRSKTNAPSPKTRKPKLTNNKSNEPIVTYKSIRVTNADAYRCNQGEFLNDTIMDFALQYFVDQTPNDNIHIFHTTFYPLLLKNPQRTASTVPPLDEKIFEKEYVFIPINEGLHWSLIIVCYANDAEKRSIMYCDSLGGQIRESQVLNVNEYLGYRYRLEDPKRDDDLIELEASLAQLPKQENSCDCGVYVIEYIEQLAKSFPEQIPVNNSKLFSQKDIDAKRKELFDNVMNLAKHQKVEASIDVEDEVFEIKKQ